MSPSVYLFEPQALFVPELSRIVAAAGGRVVRSAGVFDFGDIVSLRAQYALLDLDYTELGVADGLSYFRAAVPDVAPIVLTEERDANRLGRYRHAGAIAALCKSASGGELRDALREIFASGELYRLRGRAM
jgi:DNA-binding NarL/FixJ family response regulator